MAVQRMRLPEVMQMTTLSRSQVYALMKAGQFPRPLRVGARAVAWRADEIDAFIKTRPRGGSERPER